MVVGVIEGNIVFLLLLIQRSTIGNAGRLESLEAMALNYQLIAGGSLQKAAKQ
jgi:hypothetical protein